MNQASIPALRLQNQHLTTPDFKTPADVVQWFGAVQAQEYLGSLWAVGQRMKHATEGTIEEAIADRTIVRSWPMRGTLHFTHAQDLRWMLKLLAPRVIKRAASRYRELELTYETFHTSGNILAKALMGGKELRRDEIFRIFEEHKISPNGQRGIHILGHLAMRGLICFGSRSGKQFTFTLLDEWIPPTKPKDTNEALAELTKRYFTSHGPATIKDFAWWSGLTVTEVKRGIELTKPYLTHETIGGELHYFAPTSPLLKQKETAYLLPAYDEYTVAYKDRSAIIDSHNSINAANGLLSAMVVGGRIIGTWRRELKKHEVIVTPHMFSEINYTTRELLHEAAHRYGAFLERSVKLL
jgi:hypothetical protein